MNVPRGTIAYNGECFCSLLPVPLGRGLCFARVTANMDIAAGVIPGIRDACPREAGLTAWSFSTTSLESPDREI